MSTFLNPFLRPARVQLSQLSLQILACAALGAVLLYGVAFSHSPLAHNAAHDVRHVTVKPCH
ncbi:hypothetical protein GCM10010975_33240 [Comamonas phosphati]|nr:hypothetical protein GCM10010975_33240 [Comamonas phosphati]